MVKTKRRNIVYRKRRTNKNRGGAKHKYHAHWRAKEAARNKQENDLEKSRKEFKKLPYSVEVREADKYYQRAGPKLGFGFGGHVYKLLAKNKKELPKRLPIELKSNLGKNMYISKIHEVDESYKRSTTSSRNRFNLKLDCYYGFTKDHKVNVQKNVFMQFKVSHPSVEECFKRLVTKHSATSSKQSTRKHRNSPTISKKGYEFYKRHKGNLSPGAQELVDKYEKKNKIGMYDSRNLFDVRTPEDESNFDATPTSADLNILEQEAKANAKRNINLLPHSKKRNTRKHKRRITFSPSVKSGTSR